MNYRKPRFEFTRSDRSGAFFLALIVVCVQGLGPHIFPSNWAPKREILQPKAHGSPVENIVYNANYLSDFDAYQLGMSLKALRRYRYLRGQGYYFKNLEIPRMFRLTFSYVFSNNSNNNIINTIIETNTNMNAITNTGRNTRLALTVECYLY